MAEEKTRYNDAELEEFRILIEQKLESARADYEMLRTAINNENDTEDSSPTFKVLEVKCIKKVELRCTHSAQISTIVMQKL